MLLRIALIVALFTAGSARAVGADLNPDDVRKAIEQAVIFLESHQKVNGGWDDHPSQPGGVTSLVTLALINAGVSVDDPHIQKSLVYLRNLRSDKTYTVALQTMALCAAEPKKDLLIIRRNSQWLEETQKENGTWSYPIGRGDNSNAQFALLALHEAERVGVAVKQKTWEKALKFWQDEAQNLDGSWGYTPGAPGSGSMTCAGIASVVICSSQLSAGDATIKNGRVQCCGEQLPVESIERGLDWLARNWQMGVNPGHGGQQLWHLYYLYGLERVGRMTARRIIGTHDWYRTQAEWLLNAQDKFTHAWHGGLERLDPNNSINTSLAVLFLAKGRRPILISKLKHEPANDWNHHRSDLANLTTYTESRWKRDMTWQVIDANLAGVDDLLQTPVLFFNGRQAAAFTPEQVRTMRDYVDRGGFLFIESCCDGDDFDAAIKATLSEMFPEPEHSLKKLSPDHPIWSMEERVNPKYMRDLLGIDVGCRTSVIYCPKDLSCYWELGRLGRMQGLPQVIRDEVQACLSIGINVLAYATGRDVKYKDEVPVAVVGPPEDPGARGKLYVANLRHPGGCNSAPGALLNLLRTAGEKLKLHVSTEAREVGMTDPQLYDYHMVFMHGRSKFRLTPQEREKLKLYIQRGGVILADAICSSAEFDASFRQEMQSMFPEKPLERIPANHPMFTTAYGGDDLPTVERRQAEIAKAGQPVNAANRQTEPYLEGIKIGDRYAIIYSRYDLSCALESHDSLECAGYTRKDAARIGLNVLLYSLHQ